jgi:signal transduction histidine kinase
VILAKRQIRLSLPAALGLLFLLLVFLATMQYRWAGELSEAERSRLRAGAKARTDAFGRDFDREVTLAFVRLQLPPELLRDRDFTSFAEQYDAWRRASAHPALVRDVFLVENGGAENPRLSRYEPSLRSFRSTDWVPALSSIRERAVMLAEGPPGFDRAASERDAELSRGSVPGRGRGPLDFLLMEEVPALLMPVVVVERDRGAEPWARFRLPAFVAVTLDLGYVRDRLLPALAERHFGGAAGLDYNLAVVRQVDPRSVVWRSGAEVQTAALRDAAAGLLDLRFEEVSDGDLAAFDSRVASESRSGGRRNEGRLGDAGSFVRRIGLRGPRGPAAPPEQTGRWRLLAAYRAGSVDEVVAEARWRNLAVGIGVMVLLGASVALVVVSAQRARLLAERQMDFVAGVSHELRTPVAVICSAADNLADGLVEDPDHVRRYGAVVRAEGRRLVEMVEQVLEFAGTSSGRLVGRSENVDVGRLIDQTLETFADGLREGGFTVLREVQPPLPRVQGDPQALGRALRNLVGNALKYGADGRWLRLRAAAGETGREVLISVEDRGEGIPAAELPRVFEPFFRGRAVATQTRGFGLGLALVQRVVEAHGGRVSVVSAPGRGSVFTIRLPAARAAEEPRSEAGDGVPHPAR